MSCIPASSSLLPRIVHPFSLVIPPTTYCPGSDVVGEVLLEFPKVQDDQIEDVVVEFRGTLKAATSDSADRVSVEPQELLSVRTSIWRRGSTYPSPNSNILRIPFSFHLPSDETILPSVFWNQWHDFISIVYCVEVVALSPSNMLGSEKRVREQLVVVPRGDPSLCASIRSLGNIQGGPMWKTAHKEQQMRRGMWGEYSAARVELLVPNEHGILPHCIDIPLLIRIKTTTARLSRTKADRHLQDKPIFPAIAFTANNPISVIMRQNFAVRAYGCCCRPTNKFTLASIKEQDVLRSSYHKYWEDDTRLGDPQETGRWVQQWTFQPKVQLNRFPPTFSGKSVECAYTVSVQVPFSGVGNDVKVSIPVTLDSGIDRATPRKSGSAPTAYVWDDAPTPTSFSAIADPAAAADTNVSLGGETETPPYEQPAASELPTYFEAVYGGGREGDRAPGSSVPASRELNPSVS